MSVNVPDLQEIVCTQRVPVLWPIGCEADTLFYVKVSDAERLLKEIKRLNAIVDRLHAACGMEMSDETQGPSETCCKLWARIEEAAEKARKP